MSQSRREIAQPRNNHKSAYKALKTVSTSHNRRRMRAYSLACFCRSGSRVVIGFPIYDFGFTIFRAERSDECSLRSAVEAPRLLPFRMLRNRYARNDIISLSLPQEEPGSPPISSPFHTTSAQQEMIFELNQREWLYRHIEDHAWHRHL